MALYSKKKFTGPKCDEKLIAFLNDEGIAPGDIICILPNYISGNLVGTLLVYVARWEAFDKW